MTVPNFNPGLQINYAPILVFFVLMGLLFIGLTTSLVLGTNRQERTIKPFKSFNPKKSKARINKSTS